MFSLGEVMLASWETKGILSERTNRQERAMARLGRLVPSRMALQLDQLRGSGLTGAWRLVSAYIPDALLVGSRGYVISPP